MPTDVPTEERAEDIRDEIRQLDVRIMALRREKEDLALIARQKPWWFRLLRATAVVLRVALKVVGIASVLVLLWFLFLLTRMPR